MPSAIRTRGLTKRFGDVTAVQDLDLEVAAGELYGFLGRNGAGKTTTIRLLLGMVRPTAGAVEVLGRGVPPGDGGLWSRVGHLVEAATAYPDLTVRENLHVAAVLQRDAARARIDRAIERLSLGPYADRPARTLSSGNLQRLALARAFLHQPELVILDEPTLGLDPAGVVEIRELLSTLVTKGVTVFMSSHVLTEVERIATRIGIVHRGRLVTELSARELAGRRRLEVGVADIDAAAAILAGAGFDPTRARTASGAVLHLSDPEAIDHPERIARLLVEGDVPPTRLVTLREDVESLFMQVTGARADEPGPDPAPRGPGPVPRGPAVDP